MKRLDKLYFFIHGFCWACRDWGAASRHSDAPLRPYLAREQRCAKGWYSRLGELSDTEALVVIPGSRDGPAGDYYAKAVSALGDRCFLLDCPDCLEPQFWAGGSPDYYLGLANEIGSAFVQQHMEWNKEELHTALHCRACCRQFDAMLAQRGYAFDPATVSAEAWGASFDGCVTKYTLNLRCMLGLSNVIGINFGLTVPDASFLLDTLRCDCVLLDHGLRLFLFADGSQIFGLYTFTAHSLADQPAYVSLAVAPETVTVRSKQGIRLWPEPEMYALPAAPLGCYEPPQVVVEYGNGGLQVPVSAGFVYRLAKAPAYVFMPGEMPYAEARAILSSAELG